MKTKSVGGRLWIIRTWRSPCSFKSLLSEYEGDFLVFLTFCVHKMALHSLFASISSSTRIERKKGDFVAGSIPEKFWCSGTIFFFSNISNYRFPENISSTNAFLPVDSPRRWNWRWRYDSPDGSDFDQLTRQTEWKSEEGSRRNRPMFLILPRGSTETTSSTDP